ncbi:mucin-6 isoform X2 [Salmo salar]|uniref:Mucin-6 isoform X2 n=1 Tax=Salmo salar TaxID=8030 RepID=A0ABM3F8X3_SALSA|nr:mucin-6 isoform X2 [Salmo salar]
MFFFFFNQTDQSEIHTEVVRTYHPRDQEEIQAVKNCIGNSSAMQILLDCVQKRMNWPEELMSALEVLEHQDLADERRAEWNKHNQTNPSPAAPPTSPSLPISESSNDPTSSMVLPAWPTPPSESLSPKIAACPEDGAQPVVPTSSVAEAPIAGASPEPAPQALEAAVRPVTATQAAPSPVSVKMEPTTVSEPQPPLSHSDNAASSQPGPVETGSLEDNPSHIVLSETILTLPVSDLNPALSQTKYTPTADAPASVQASERRPVQDTTPPTAKVTTFHQKPVEDSVPTATQVTEDDQHTELSQSPPSHHFSPVTAPASPPVHTSMDEDNRELSKPDVPLASVPGPLTTATPLTCQEHGVPEELEESVSRNEPEEDTYQEVLINVIHVSEDAYIQNQEGQTQSMLGNNDAGVSETLPPVQNHNRQSQITPLSGSTELDLSSGPNQHDQTEDSLGKAVSKSEDSQGLIMIANGHAAIPSTKQPDPPPPASSPSVTIVNGSSADNCPLPVAVEAEVMLKDMMASVVPKLKQKREREGATIGGSYYFLGAAVLSVSALFVAWRMKN